MIPQRSRTRRRRRRGVKCLRRGRHARRHSSKAALWETERSLSTPFEIKSLLFLIDTTGLVDSAPTPLKSARRWKRLPEWSGNSEPRGIRMHAAPPWENVEHLNLIGTEVQLLNQKHPYRVFTKSCVEITALVTRPVMRLKIHRNLQFGLETSIGDILARSSRESSLRRETAVSRRQRLRSTIEFHIRMSIPRNCMNIPMNFNQNTAVQ